MSWTRKSYPLSQASARVYKSESLLGGTIVRRGLSAHSKAPKPLTVLSQIVRHNTEHSRPGWTPDRL